MTEPLMVRNPLSRGGGSRPALLVVCVRPESDPTLLRRQSPRQRLRAGGIPGAEIRHGLFLRLQAHRQQTVVRWNARHALIPRGAATRRLVHQTFSSTVVSGSRRDAGQGGWRSSAPCQREPAAPGACSRLSISIATA